MQKDNMNSFPAFGEEEQDKFLALYHQHEQQLLRYAQSLSRPPITSDDVLQESVLQAVQKFSALRNEAKFASWFSKIILRTYLRMLKNADAEKRRTNIYTEMRLKRQDDSEAKILEEMDSRIDKSDPGMTAGPHAKNTMSQEVPKPHLSPADEIHCETIRDGLESFNEIQNETDFHPWIEGKSKKVRKSMHKNQKRPQKRIAEKDHEKDGQE